MVTYSSKYRSTEPEIMDSFELQGEEMKLLLTDLKIINSYLGGTSVTLDGLKVLLRSHTKDGPITIVDMGCGDGEILRKCADLAEANGYHFQLIGVDANHHILEEAKIRSSGYPSITFRELDVFSEAMQEIDCDIVLCTLFLHHFGRNDILKLLSICLHNAKVGVIINDLHRSRWAFWLFGIFSKIFINTRTAQHDGLVSIARGFKRSDIKNMQKHFPNTEQRLRWKWAFRYQWIIKTNK
ncbi:MULTISPECIES: methyltransferase domain-containing protein [Altibacter]|uniref:methyltransferase domain-containing protein n=1 Tax=Altibacter TaxID=1535231 RepID=UPI0005593014|nr:MULTISPECIES: methyltransferase domain-containing protein [Altibacter]MCW9036898.1 methyltransferase domain-containing protein [Altibacter sp.]